jgi:hypothetical protein
MTWRWLDGGEAKALGGAVAVITAAGYIALGGPELGQTAGAAWSTILTIVFWWWLTPPGTSEQVDGRDDLP